MKGYSVSLMSHAECTHETTRVARQKCRRDRERLGIDATGLKSQSCAPKTVKRRDPQERFLAQVVMLESGCWEWQGSKNDQGYGRFKVDGKTYAAHRWSLEQKLGRSLREGEVARHKCDVVFCVAPDHLEPGTHLENRLDRIKRGPKGPGRHADCEHPDTTAGRAKCPRTRRYVGGLNTYDRFMTYVDGSGVPMPAGRGWGSFLRRGMDSSPQMTQWGSVETTNPTGGSWVICGARNWSRMKWSCTRAMFVSAVTPAISELLLMLRTWPTWWQRGEGRTRTRERPTVTRGMNSPGRTRM